MIDESTPATLLLVEPDPQVAAALINAAAACGIVTRWCTDGATALVTVGATTPTAIVASVNIATVSIADLIATVREHYDIPVVVGVDDDDRHARSFADSVGATAVVSRPYDMALISTIAGLAEHHPAHSALLRAGPLSLDRTSHIAHMRDRELALSNLEFELLTFLLDQRGRIASHNEISRSVWHRPTAGTNTVAVHIKRLREKLGSDAHHGQLIRTVRGRGYGLAPSLFN